MRLEDVNEQSFGRALVEETWQIIRDDLKLELMARLPPARAAAIVATERNETNQRGQLIEHTASFAVFQAGRASRVLKHLFVRALRRIGRRG